MVCHGFGMVWNSLVWFGVVWYGLLWFDMVWYGWRGPAGQLKLTSTWFGPKLDN